MDIRAYFRKLRETEKTIGPEWVVMVSNETADGGRAGRRNEVGREMAARMLVDGSGRLATDIETREFREDVARQIEQAVALEEASRIRLMFTTDKLERAHRKAPKSKV